MDIEIEGDMIRLGQLLKLSALADSAADARELLLASVVTVNGDPEVAARPPAAPRRRGGAGRADRPSGLTGSMACTTSEARQELLDSVAQAANGLGFASACLAEAYERLDEHSGNRLEAECFRPVQMAYGRAKRAPTEFARRHGFPAAAVEP
jgi:hypothetical protein